VIQHHCTCSSSAGWADASLEWSILSSAASKQKGHKSVLSEQRVHLHRWCGATVPLFMCRRSSWGSGSGWGCGLRLGLGVGLRLGLWPTLDWGSGWGWNSASCHLVHHPGDGLHSRSGCLDSLLFSSETNKGWHLSPYSSHCILVCYGHIVAVDKPGLLLLMLHTFLRPTSCKNVQYKIVGFLLCRRSRTR
jgi:hypothetical protein